MEQKQEMRNTEDMTDLELSQLLSASYDQLMRVQQNLGACKGEIALRAERLKAEEPKNPEPVLAE